MMDMTREIRELWAELRKFRTVPVRQAFGGRGSGGTSSGNTVSECSCGSCLGAGAIDGCVAVGEASTNYTMPTPPEFVTYFGATLTLTWISGCTWETDEFTGVTIGTYGPHDFFFRLVMTDTGLEGAEVTLEDET